MWPNPQFPADLVTFTEEILNGKLHFLWSALFCLLFFLWFLSKMCFKVDYFIFHFILEKEKHNIVTTSVVPCGNMDMHKMFLWRPMRYVSVSCMLTLSYVFSRYCAIEERWFLIFVNGCLKQTWSLT